MKKMPRFSLLIAALLTALSPSNVQALPAVPQELIQAIARHESAMNPFAVNVAGKSYQPSSLDEALVIIAAAQAAGDSFDVGLMQINNWWIQKFNIPVELLLDAEINTQWGTWILAQEIERHGFNWVAVGKYHSPDLERGRQYAWRIFQHMPKTGQQPKEDSNHVDQTPANQDLSDTGGVFRNPGRSRQGRFINLEIHQADVAGATSQKP